MSYKIDGPSFRENWGENGTGPFQYWDTFDNAALAPNTGPKIRGARMDSPSEFTCADAGASKPVVFCTYWAYFTPFERRRKQGGPLTAPVCCYAY